MGGLSDEQLLLGVNPAVIALLEQHFPDRAPDPSTPDREVWIKVGQVSVVKFLKTQLERIESDNYEGLL